MGIGEVNFQRMMKIFFIAISTNKAAVIIQLLIIEVEKEWDINYVK